MEITPRVVEHRSESTKKGRIKPPSRRLQNWVHEVKVITDLLDVVALGHRL